MYPVVDPEETHAALQFSRCISSLKVVNSSGSLGLSSFQWSHHHSSFVFDL